MNEHLLWREKQWRSQESQPHSLPLHWNEAISCSSWNDRDIAVLQLGDSLMSDETDYAHISHNFCIYLSQTLSS